MVLDMQSMTVGGRGYLVSTTDVSRIPALASGPTTRPRWPLGGGAARMKHVRARCGRKRGKLQILERACDDCRNFFPTLQVGGSYAAGVAESAIRLVMLKLKAKDFVR